MATYAVGDVQGCYTELCGLLDKVNFDQARDRLWLVGDLVNRGPDSLAVLRMVRSLGDSAIAVLGNHDLHLLAVAEGVIEPHHSDTLDEVLYAPDGDELLDWLRHRPLLHTQDEFALVHAGLLPQWTIAQASSLAREVEEVLRGDDYAVFLARMYGNQPDLWDDGLQGYERLRLITNAFTRMRICTPEGRMQLHYKGELGGIPPGYLSWFDVPGRKSRETTMIFGHWSALGLMLREREWALDSGCLWGGVLSAVRLEGRAVCQIGCHAPVPKDWTV